MPYRLLRALRPGGKQTMRLLLLAGMVWAAGGVATAQDALPNVEQLRARAVENNKKTELNREKYMCRELITEQELDSKGRVKKTTVTERESFSVNKHSIVQVIARDGKPLSADEQRKQQENVKKAIDNATSANPKKQTYINVSDFIKLAKLTNERRVMVAGRPTIVFDAAGDESHKPGNVAEKIEQAMAGTISIDEQTGTPQDVRMQGFKDVKVGGGMVANIHKGFQLHLRLAPQPDGVWLVEEVEGAGDARIGLFMHPAAHFKQQTEGCKLYNVNAESVEKLPRAK